MRPAVDLGVEDGLESWVVGVHGSEWRILSVSFGIVDDEWMVKSVPLGVIDDLVVGVVAPRVLIVHHCPLSSMLLLHHHGLLLLVHLWLVLLLHRLSLLTVHGLLLLDLLVLIIHLSLGLLVSSKRVGGRLLHGARVVTTSVADDVWVVHAVLLGVVWKVQRINY